MTKKVEKQSWGPFIKRVLGPNVPWLWFLANVIAQILTSTLLVQGPALSGRIMAGEIFNRSLLFEYVLVLTGSLFLNFVITVSRLFSCYYAERNIQTSLWKKMIHMTMRRYDRQPPSVLISRVTNDPAQLSNTFGYIMTTVNVTYSLILRLALIWKMSSQISLALLLVLPYVLIVTIVPGRFYYRAKERIQETFSQYTTFVSERLGNIALVKSAANENVDWQMGYELAEKNYKAELKFYLITAIASPFVQSINGIIGAITLIAGSILVQNGQLAMSDLITMYMYSSTLSSYMLTYTEFFQNLKQSQGATAVIAELMDSKSEVAERTKSFTQPDSDFIFDGVTFCYENKKVLKDVHLTIPKQKVTAIVGPSGAGKTTLLSLLERLYTPDEGELKFGDTPVEEIHLNEWRGATGYIQQSSPLISGSIRDNIVYGLNRKASDEEVIQAAKQANAYEFITKLPEGFDTNVGQLGGRLSGGERQRIAIARMIIKDPDYLLLDEATSSLDAENEMEVQTALNRMMKGRTAVVVAHNLRTIVHADHIVVMNDGRVEAEGTHETLYRENERYRKYFDLQFAK